MRSDFSLKKQKTMQYIIKKIVVIIYDNNVIEPFNNNRDLVFVRVAYIEQ